MNDLAGANPTASLDDIGAACLARARGLIPLLQSAADRIDASNELPPDVLDAMFDAGMFKLLLPRAIGGFELKPADYIQCVEAIAEGDASAAWCMNQGSGCSMAAAYCRPTWRTRSRAASATWWPGARGRAPRRSAPTAAGASPAPGVSPAARVTPPGWARCARASRRTARRSCGPMDGPGNGPSCSRASKAKIDDVWQVMGLRGTGSDNYTIKDLFVDDAHSLTREYEPERRQHGALVYVPGDAAVRERFCQRGTGYFTRHAGRVHRAGEDQKPGLVVGSVARQSGGAAYRQLLRCGVEGGAGRACTRRWTMRGGMSRGPACCRWNTAWRSGRRRPTRSTSPATWRIRCSTRRARRRSSTSTRSSGGCATSTACPSSCRDAARISKRSATTGWAASRTCAGFNRGRHDSVASTTARTQRRRWGGNVDAEVLFWSASAAVVLRC